jgi:hypothetical protein
MARENYKVAPNVNVESDNLLRIIHNGIDDIIVNLKRAVDAKGDGTDGTIEKTNDAVVKILKVFSDFQDGKIPGTDEPMKDTVNINRDTYNKELGQEILKPDFYGSNKQNVMAHILKNNTDVSQNNIDTQADILDLRTGINYNTYGTNNETEITITNGNQTQLTERLKNCSRLEQLYLNKHAEIIRIFGFVVDLFDKYKYAIKVILFLLKNLVRAEQGNVQPGDPGDPGDPSSVNVRLPKPLITNINLLLKDQANIQTIIDGMENVVNTTDTNIRNGVDTKRIKLNLDDITIPQPAIPQAPAPQPVP